MEKFEEIFNFINSDIMPQLKMIVTGKSVLLCTAAFIIIMMYIGYRRGFVDRAIALGAMIITLIAEIKIFPYVMEFLLNNDTVHEMLISIGQSLLHVDAEGASSPLYKLLGLDIVAENAGVLAGTIAVKILCFVLIFVAVRLLLAVVQLLFRGLKQIRIINFTDKVLGMVLGLAEAMLIVWIVMLLISGFPNIPICKTILDQITGDPILLGIYNQNLLIIFIADLLK